MEEIDCSHMQNCRVLEAVETTFVTNPTATLQRMLQETTKGVFNRDLAAVLSKKRTFKIAVLTRLPSVL